MTETLEKPSFSLSSLEPYEGKKLQSLTIASGDDGSEELQNVVLVGVVPGQGAVCQVPKRGAVMYKENEILDFEPPVVKPPKRKVKNLKEVDRDTVGEHLLDRHGASYEQIDGLNPDEQLNWHNELHNTEGVTLYHKHGAPKGESPAEKAVEAAAAEASSAETAPEGDAG